VFLKGYFLSIALIIFSIFTSSLSVLPSAYSQISVEDQNFVNSYAPKLYFTADEKFYPTSVHYVITSSVLMKRISNSERLVIDNSPLPRSLGEYTDSDLYLDNKLKTFEEIVSDYSSKSDQLGYDVYVHIFEKDGFKIIQYWFLYVYNNGLLNEHQGDWEVIQIFINDKGNPSRAIYSQHINGENAKWEDVEKFDQTHPVVYVAQGSHANYFRPYQGKIVLEHGIVGNDGLVIEPEDLNLVILGERNSHSTDQSWLDFTGRWGYWGTDEEVVIGMAGPLGPIDNQNGKRWAQPTLYLNDTFEVNSSFFIVSWIVANSLILFAIYVILRGGLKVIDIRKMILGEGFHVVEFLKSRGGLGVIIGIVGITISFIALTLPWYTVSASSELGPLSGEGMIDLVTIDGINGFNVNLFLGTDSEASSGFVHVFSTIIPFSLLILPGLILLFLDIIGVKNPRSIGRKMLIGAAFSLTPFIVIYIFIMLLSSLLPLAMFVLPNQVVPAEVTQLMDTISANPLVGDTSQVFPTIGRVDVLWGFGSGVYFFLFAAIARIISAIIIGTVPRFESEDIHNISE
jgi:hypothetical protein